ncbi:hypothetical protein [Celeribacter sp.]|uniref:hypothetical protein n=1 Tax=Celeribacter sp. TaxID=1890673 RepID=UPI003A8E04D6
MKIKALVLLAALIPTGVVAQQNFSCNWGDRGACLGYGETVCSSSGKCVSSDAVCFDSYQCNYEGFTCKSNLTECADEYDGLLKRFNALVEDYNYLLEDNRRIRAAFETSLEELEETQDALSDAQSNLFYARQERDEARDALADIVACIDVLGRFEDASNCLP